MSDLNNPRTLEGLREKIRAIAAATSLAQAQYDHTYQSGWIGALYWTGVIDRAVHDQLLAEIVDALQGWQPPKG